MKKLSFVFLFLISLFLQSCSEDCELCTKRTVLLYENLDAISQSEFDEIFPNDTTLLELDLCGDDLKDLKGETTSNSIETTKVGIKLRQITEITHTCN